MNSLTENEKLKDAKNLNWEKKNASPLQKSGGVDKHRRQRKDSDNGGQWPDGEGRDRSTEVDGNTQRRGLPEDSGRESGGIIVARSQHGEARNADEKFAGREKMNIMTARFGEIDIDPAKIITFNNGVIGFPDYKRYIFFPFMEGTEFELLQAVDHPNLGFVVVNPFLFKQDYEFNIDDHVQEALQLKSNDESKVKVIVTIPDDPADMTANLQAPIILHEGRLIGMQVILQDSGYQTKHPVFASAEQV